MIILLVAGLYWGATSLYNQFIASEYQVKLPFGDQNRDALYITNIKGASDPTFDQLLQFLKNDDTDEYASQYSDSLLGQCVVRLHNNAEKAGIKSGVAELNFDGETNVYALNVFNTVDKGYVWVDCTGNPYDVAPEAIVHMDGSNTHHMVFTAIEDAPASFLADMGNMSECYATETCDARIDSYTW